MTSAALSSKPFSIATNCGCHGPYSPVLGSRANEQRLICKKIEKEPIFGEFEQALYYKENSPSFNYLIPIHQKEEADQISRNIFLDYIKNYADQNAEISENTIVDWCLFTESPGECRIVRDRRNHLGWHITAKVRAKESPVYKENANYLPPYLIAYHEIQHIEDATPFAEHLSWSAIKQGNNSDRQGLELKETLKTQILCDQVYKQINGMDIDSLIDHNKSILLQDKEIALGSVLNFYRKLEERYNGSLCEALLSPQSTEFLEKGRI